MCLLLTDAHAHTCPQIPAPAVVVSAAYIGPVSRWTAAPSLQRTCCAHPASVGSWWVSVQSATSLAVFLGAFCSSGTAEGCWLSHDMGWLLGMAEPPEVASVVGWVFLCLCVCERECTYLCISQCVCVWTLAPMCAHTCACLWASVCICMHVCRNQSLHSGLPPTFSRLCSLGGSMSSFSRSLFLAQS